MRIAALGLTLVLTLLAGGLSPAAAQDDALSVPGPIRFEGTTFALAWTSHPNVTYYKQEYLPDGETLEAYNQMFIVEVVTDGATPQSAAQGLIGALDERSATDPVVNYDLMANESTGELILDFLLSDDSSGTIIVEWNAYRYVPFGEGVALFAISRRGYDAQASGFIAGLGNWRKISINALAQLVLPQITLVD